jgi:hypothetical protein
MTGSEQCYGTYADFCEALGYDAANESGYKVHSETAKVVSDISFCYPTSDRVAEPPALSGMYYSFNSLAKFFSENLVCKKGDASDIRGYHINLLYWCKPGHQRKIDVCDFIYCELKRSVLSLMTPGYCAFVQKFIDSRVAGKFAHTVSATSMLFSLLGLVKVGWSILTFVVPRLLPSVLPVPLVPAMLLLLARKVELPSSSRICGICARIPMMWHIKP